MGIIYKSLMVEEKHLEDQYELKSLIHSLSQRWNDIVERSDNLMPTFDRQYSSWLLFESELNSFRDQTLIDLEKRFESFHRKDELQSIVDLNHLNDRLNDLRVRKHFQRRNSTFVFM